MKNLNYNSQLQSIHKNPSFLMTAVAVSLAVISLTAQAGKIISNPTTDLGVIQDGFGGLNFDNVDVVLNGALSTFDELTGAYSFSVDSDHTYQGNVDDGSGVTFMGYTLAKDWPVGEPAGIKVVNDDFDVKEGKPTNCIMSTSYLADHFLDATDPIQVPCSGPFQSHKRYKLAMLPTTIDGGVEGVDLVFNVEDEDKIDPDTNLPFVSRDYQVFQKINNWTNARLQGFTIQVGFGVGTAFVPASTTVGVGVTNLSLSVPSTVWNAKQLANFSSGLFGPADLKHDRPPGYFDPVDPAGFFIEEYGVGELGDLSGQTDILTATTTLGSDYVDTPPGAAAASAASVTSLDANQFGPWLPNTMLPLGIFFDDDGNPETDAELQAWYGYNPTIDALGWMTGADLADPAKHFAIVTDAEILNKGKDLTMTMGVIDDLVNVGLNYVVTIGDVSSFPNSAFTIRITPTADASGTPAPSYVGQVPAATPVFPFSDALVSLDPAVFNIGDLITARVGDADENDPNVLDTVDVTITSSDSSIPPLTLTLEEQGIDRGVFAAPLPDVYSDVAAGAEVTVTMEYIDAINTSGVPVTMTATASTEIIEPAGTLQFNPVSYTVAENGGSVAVTVERIDGSAGVATVAYMTVSGTAIGGQDYTADDGILTFGDGVVSQTITIAILDNAVVDGDKTFTLQLSDTQVADAGAADEATVVITDEDVAAATPIDNVVIPADDDNGLFGLGLGWITAGLFVIALLGRIRRKTV